MRFAACSVACARSSCSTTSSGDGPAAALYPLPELIEPLGGEDGRPVGDADSEWNQIGRAAMHYRFFGFSEMFFR